MGSSLYFKVTKIYLNEPTLFVRSCICSQITASVKPHVILNTFGFKHFLAVILSHCAKTAVRLYMFAVYLLKRESQFTEWDPSQLGCD